MIARSRLRADRIMEKMRNCRMKTTGRTASDRNRIPVYVAVLLLSTALSSGPAFSDVPDAYGRFDAYQQVDEYQICVQECVRAVEIRYGSITTRQRQHCEDRCKDEVAWIPYSHAPGVALRSHPLWGRLELATGGKQEIEFRAGIFSNPCYTKSAQPFL